MEGGVLMSYLSDTLETAVASLDEAGLVSPQIWADGEKLSIEGRAGIEMPGKEKAWSWRTTVNGSLLPISVSSENRRHLLYAVLQDLINPRLLLHQDSTSAEPLKNFRVEFAPFEGVYSMPTGGSSDRTVFFPVHASVLTAFDTYKRRPNLKPQTDKGFRGKFINFFSSDPSGNADPQLRETLTSLFARTAELTPLDRALVEALNVKLLEEKRDVLEQLAQEYTLETEARASEGWWGNVFEPIQVEYRPLPTFAEQGRRLADDIEGIVNARGLSRIRRVAFVEQLLAYHFALYLVRLTTTLYAELDWAYKRIWPGRSESPWSDRSLAVYYNEPRARVPTTFHDAYKTFTDQLNEAYLLLPLLNNIELAVRGVAESGAPVSIKNNMWTDARMLLDSLEEPELKQVREVLSILAKVSLAHAGTDSGSGLSGRLPSDSIELLFSAVRLHYSDPDQIRYPKEHHQLVFESVAGHGVSSFLQRHPFRHVRVGDEVLYLLVLTLFEHRDFRRVQAARLPLRTLEQRLEQDLLIPARQEARMAIRDALVRLGLIDRLSDVGEGNFLRHPIRG
jgi:hypothetical protein